jgi:hypothetical protein
MVVPSADRRKHHCWLAARRSESQTAPRFRKTTQCDSDSSRLFLSIARAMLAMTTRFPTSYCLTMVFLVLRLQIVSLAAHRHVISVPRHRHRSSSCVDTAMAANLGLFVLDVLGRSLCGSGSLGIIVSNCAVTPSQGRRSLTLSLNTRI